MNFILKATRGAIREDSGGYTPMIIRLITKSTSIKVRLCVQKRQRLGHERTSLDNRKRKLKRNKEKRRSFVKSCRTVQGRKVERRMIY